MSATATRGLFSSLVALILLPGCSHTPTMTPEIDKAAAEFYWPYAALASNVYATKGSIDVDTNAALASPFLRAEVRDAKSDDLTRTYINLDRKKLTTKYKDQLQKECGDAALETKDQAALTAAHCRIPQPADGQAKQQDAEDTPPTETNRLEDAVPTALQDCNYDGAKDPSVPIHTIHKEYGWTDVPELQKYAPARRWSFFVPDLAIDVWRRKLDAAPSFEYAIVYRGTIGSGGWATNFRGLAAITPAVWDQYHQARDATKLIINQIYVLHAMSDEIFRRPEKTRITFTAVGHSLGAGLAQYVYLKMPQIDKVVGFDPTPLNGTSLVPIRDRQGVMGQRAGHDGKPTIFMLSEYGEMLSKLAPCESGPIWGEEGGPVVACNTVNLSRGSPFRQHNMPQLACKLYVVKANSVVRAEKAASIQSTAAQQ